MRYAIALAVAAALFSLAGPARASHQSSPPAPNPMALEGQLQLNDSSPAAEVIQVADIGIGLYFGGHGHHHGHYQGHHHGYNRSFYRYHGHGHGFYGGYGGYHGYGGYGGYGGHGGCRW